MVKSSLIIEGIKKAVQKMIDQQVMLDGEIVLIDKDGKPYRVKARDLKK
ncbi:MAG TPA: hypothetical protein VKG26_02305 [Bacteroidia bacterium]|nr:hypothetical protein [Bacteroidia bacterium]